MEEINWIRVIAGMLLVLFLPGYTLIQAMFPRRGELDEEFDTLYRITLGMAMSICVVILIGFVLGNPSLGNAPDWGDWSDGDKGYFQTFFVSTSLIFATLLFFGIGWYRCAYPWMANLHPSLARAPPGLRIESELAVAGKYIPAELIESIKTDPESLVSKYVFSVIPTSNNNSGTYDYLKEFPRSMATERLKELIRYYKEDLTIAYDKKLDEKDSQIDELKRKLHDTENK